jgi:hypothetical protein
MFGGALVGGGIDAYQQYEQNCGSFNNFNCGEFAGAAATGALTGLLLGFDPGEALLLDGELSEGATAQVLANK